MKLTNEAILQALSSLAVAVSDLRAAQDATAPSPYQQQLEGYLQTESQQIQTVYSQLRDLGAEL